MKLIRCHIENFGKISNDDYNFDTKLTTFCKENGYGKTTLAHFLKAMFYGLESDRANSGFNERRRFAPFAGGAFGGFVIFEAEGKQYKVERFFDEKSETKDSLKVYCGGTMLQPFTETVGEKFFGIDKQSFERTIFISGADIDISSTSSINTKLNNFVAGSNDNTNLESALARLESKSKEYKKSRTGNDLITRETLRLNSLSERIKNAEDIQSGLAARYAAYDEKVKHIAGLNEKISRAQSENVVIANWENYDGIIADIDVKKTRLRQIKANYPFGMPSREEIDATKTALERERTFNAQSERKLFSDGDMSRFLSLQAKFSDGVPDDSTLAKVQKDISEEANLTYSLETAAKDGLSDKELALMQKFRYRTPAQNEIAELKNKAERLKSAEEECNKIPDFINSTEYIVEQTQKTNKTAFLIAAAICALLCVGGIVCAFLMTIVGVVLLAGGVAGLAITGFLYLNKKANGRQSGVERSIQKENPEKLDARKRVEAAYAEVQAFLIPYGYSLENGVTYAVAMLVDDVNAFKELQTKTELQKAQTDEQTGRKQALENELTSFFAKYEIVAGSFVERLAKLRSDISLYGDLKTRKRNAAEDESTLKEKIVENRKPIIDFCQKYKIDIELVADKINAISKDFDDNLKISKDIKEAEEKAARFLTEKGLSQRPEGAAVDLKALNEELAKEQDNKNLIFNAITDDEREVEKLDDLNKEYAQAKGRLDEYRKNYDLLCKTIKCLEQADKNLKDKYIKPVKDQFIYYSDILEKTLGDKISMNTNFEIRYERYGRERSERHLSSGQRSLCALCFRLALIDNMYSEEKPFIVLDDPFVNLDEEHIHKAKALLEKISEKLQIIYFSCHSSRAV